MFFCQHPRASYSCGLVGLAIPSALKRALFKLLGWLKMLFRYNVGVNNNLGHQNKVFPMEVAKC